jgi:hypothetical protein
MQELPHGLPLVQCGPLVSVEPPLRQELMNCFRASPVMPLACVLQSFIRWLLLRVELCAGGRCERYQYRNRDKSPFHRRSSLEPENPPSMQQDIVDFSHELQSLAFRLEIPQ